MGPKFITIFAIVVASLFVLFFLVGPKFGSVQDMRTAVFRQKQNVSRLVEELEVTKNALSRFQGLDKMDLERVEKFLPNGLDAPNLLVHLDSLVASAGLVAEVLTLDTSDRSLTSIAGSTDPGTTAGLDTGQGSDLAPKFLAQESLGSATINLTVRGNYESFKPFLESIEESLRIFDVENIAFSSPQITKEGVGAFRFAVVLKTYYAK